MASSDADQRFIPYEKMAQRLSQWHSQKLDSIKKWVALEKIHGANFSFTVTCRAQETQLEPIGTESLATVMVARRGDYLKDGEYFFGVLTQREFIELEKEKARHVCAMVRQRIDSDAHLTESVTIFGELFGGYYPHPLVAPCPGVSNVQKEVVYCPDLKFCAYDIAVSTNDQQQNRRYLDYDVCMELFKASGFLYAEPLVIGTLQTMNSFPLGFESKLPAKFGLPALDKPNVAEGIVIKPLKNVVLDTKKGPKRVIFKRKVQGFAEVKSRGLGRGYKRQAEPWTPGGSSQDFELLRYEMLALITTQRAVNVISKLGRPCSPSQQAKKTESISASNNDCVGNSKESVETQTKKKSSETIPVDNLVEWKDIVQGLVKDVIEELESEYSELWTSCQRDKEKIRELMCKMRDQCIECVEEYKKSLME